MKKVAKLVYAFGMLALMLFGVFGAPGKSAFGAGTLLSGMGSLLRGSVSGLQSTAGGLSSGGSPIPVERGATSAPSQTAAPAQTSGEPSGSFASTGIEGLSVYPYGRTLLTAQEQTAYDAVQSGLVGLQGDIPLTSAVQPTAMQKVVEYVMRDHPETFYLKETSMTYSKSLVGGSIHYTVHFKYAYGKAEAAAMREKLRAAAAPMLAAAQAQSDPVKKELALHDALVEKCAYNEPAAENPDAYPSAYTAYGALVDGSAVCEGYAKALKLLLDSAGLRSLYVTGTAGSGGNVGPHAWNQVYVGRWYQVDATFDDPVYQTASGKYVQTNKRDYTYFNFTQKNDHILGLFDASQPFAAQSENYDTMPAL